jgi:hypothetical protein
MSSQLALDEPEISTMSSGNDRETRHRFDEEGTEAREDIVSRLKKKPMTQGEIKQKTGWSPARVGRYIQAKIKDDQLVEGVMKVPIGEQGRLGTRFVRVVFHPEMRLSVETGQYGEIFLLASSYRSRKSNPRK